MSVTFSDRRDPTGIIIAEYNYLAQTAFQANEDRARVAQFFLTSVGAFGALLFTPQLQGKAAAATFAVVFFTLAGFGAITIYKLVALRRAWLGSVMAMNHVKAKAIEFYPELEGVFPWGADAVPPRYKPNSLGALNAMAVAFIGGLAFGAGILFGLTALGVSAHWVIAFAAGLPAAAGSYLLLYRRPLKAGS